MKTAASSTTSISAAPCVAQEARDLNLFATTPLVHSIPLSRLCHPHPVYLKLDLLQQSGSFKDRGMAHLCSTARRVYESNNRRIMGRRRGDGGEDDADGSSEPTSGRMKVISSSGGNAGLAVTTVARKIPGMDVSVVVPETTKTMVVEKLRGLGAEVTVHGNNWNEADALAREWVDESEGAVYGEKF